MGRLGPKMGPQASFNGQEGDRYCVILDQFTFVLEHDMVILDPWTKIWAARTRIWDKNGSIGDQFRIRKRVPLIVCYRVYRRFGPRPWPLLDPWVKIPGRQNQDSAKKRVRSGPI